MANPHNPGELSVTVKYGKGYEESWAVFRGPDSASIRTQMLDYFGVESATVESLTLHELVINLTKVAHGTSAVASRLNGAVIPKSDEPTATATGDAWSQAEAKAAEPAVNPLVAQIEACPTVADLQRLWAENKATFDTDADLMAAYKVKGKSLSTIAETEKVAG